MKKLTIAVLAIAAMASCNKEDNISPENGDVKVAFTASEINTRISSDGTKWSVGDSIGITMFNLDGLTETLANNGDNIKYVSDNDSEQAEVGFSVGSGNSALVFPNSGEVKFYAYYPYQPTMTADSYLYSADVSEQATADFMTAAPVSTERTTDAQILVFSHQLAKLTISITKNENVSSLSGLTVEATGLNTKGTYSILDGEQEGELSDTSSSVEFTTEEYVQNVDNSFSLVSSGDTQVDKVIATAIVLPETLSSEATVTFSLGSRTFVINFAQATEFLKANNHTYNVALGNDVPDFGNCTITGWGEQIMDDLYSTETTSSSN